MATISTSDNSLSFLTDTLGGFVGRAAPKLAAFSGRLDGMLDTIFMALDSGSITSASSTKLVVSSYYPYYAQMTISGSGFTGNSFTISKINYRAYDGFFINMSGSVRGNAYGSISGSVTSMSIGDSEQSVAYYGSMSMTTGAARYSSLTYTLRDGLVSNATTSFSYGGSFVEDYDGVVRGTATSFTFSRDADGSGPGASQTIVKMTGISRYVELDADALHPFGFLAADTDDFFMALMDGADTVTGGSGDDVLYGYAGNDTLNGGAGADEMHGGEGDDRYIVDHENDLVIEEPGQGNDTVSASVSYTLGDNVENLVLTGNALVGTGNELSNTLTGNAKSNVLRGLGGDDVLDGGAGADTLIGGEGDDLYFVDNAGDTVVELDGEGTDTVRVTYSSKAKTAVNLTLQAGGYEHVENLEVTGAGLFNLTGNDASNILRGNASANVIDGGAGADRMEGGLGNDTYIVDDAGDEVIEVSGKNSGVDLVRASVDYTLGANVENLKLEGAAVVGTGNEGANVLTGNELDNELYGLGGNDVLDGGLGNDLLDGGEGADRMVGGLGDDTYIVDNVRDVVVEGLNGGTDTVRSSLDYVLGAHLENLVLTGTALKGTGNALDNVITGNAQNNVLDGGAGADTLIGGEGDDQYVVDNLGDTIIEQADEGTDSVRFTLANTSVVELELDLGSDYAHVENAVLAGAGRINLTGSEAANMLTGNAQSNVLRGLGGDDVLDGGAGADTLIGGEGDDLYFVDNAGDTVVELDGEGTDTVRVTYSSKAKTAVNLTLQAGGYEHVENLEVTGAGLFNLTGNDASNILRGNASANVIDGGAGADRMEGGLGNDTYIVDDAGDEVIEVSGKNSGVDLVRASVDYTLGANVENLKLEGAAVVGTGNEGANVLTGNELDNELYGLGGNDVLDGGLGNDLLDGGEGADRMVGGLGDDTYIVDNVRDVVVEGLNGGTDTVRSSLDYVLGAHLENLVLTGTALKGTGNALDNVITGNAQNNVLDGGAGADTLIGGEGDDQYVVDNLGDTIIEQADEGTDSVRFTLANTSVVELELDLGSDYAHVENAVLAGAGRINLTGSEAANMLTGNAQSNVLRGLGGDDVLDGGAGADTLIGGEGDDLYFVDNAGDTVVELDGEGTDTVRVTYSSKAKTAVNLTLQAGGYEHVENLEVTGAGLFNLTGNDASNILRGNASANVIDGGAGADRMEGGLGNDTYIVDDAGDEVIEVSGKNSGVDLVRASVDYTLGANVENLKLEGAAVVGTGNEGANVLTGNELDNELYGLGGNDVLDGGLGNDLLDGGEGADRMVGGLGDDTYIVDNVRDVVVEGLNGGTDTVRSSLDYVLGAHLENLVLTGTALKGTGNALDNVITGNAQNNVLDGGAGADTLIGGEGDDQYVVDNLGDTIIEQADEGTDSVRFTLANTSVVELELDLGSDYAHVENAVLAGAGRINLTGSEAANMLTGNAQSNVLRGLGGDDVLDGGAGADTLIGGEGDDLYFVDNAGDTVVELDGEGTDTVRVTYSSKAKTAVNLTLQAGGYEHVENLEVTGAGLFNLTGNDASNILRGNASANVIDGGAGADRMEGGLGNDTYIVDDAGDEVIEVSGKNSGVDLVRASVDYTLGANVENLKLEGAAVVGTGNEGANVLTGNELDNELYGLGGNDVLDGGLGNDLLDGGEGADRMVGGLGDDTYIVDNVRDVVVEGLNGGTDTVRSSLDYVLGAHLENLVLTGTALKGTGNALDNVITGNAQNNVLSGGAGNDTLSGGAGNDTLIGGDGADWLHGGSGLNTLTGGSGDDIFCFDAPAEAGTLQTITDFNLLADTLLFDATVFDGLGGGFDGTPAALPASMLQIGAGSEALSADARLIYDTSSGALYYDADGDALGASAIQIAQLNGKPLLSVDHFEVIAS